MATEAPERSAEAQASLPTRLWRLRLGAHAVALALILVALLPLIGTNGIVSADEGVVLYQANRLAAGDGWTALHPFPKADPDGRAFPFEFAARGERGYAPYSKLPLYPLALAGSIAVFGDAGPFVVSIMGTVAAALLAAALARQLGVRHQRAVLWLVGMGSPLFVDSYWVMAHTAAAACAAALCSAVLAARRSWFAIPAALAACALGVMLRNEFLLFAGAVTLAAAWFAWSQRSYRIGAAGLAAIAGAGIGAVGNRFWERAILGRVVDGQPPVDLFSLAGRPLAFFKTWLYPGGTVTAILLLLLGTALIFYLGFIARRRPAERFVAVVAVVCGAAFIGRLFMPFDEIAGLLVAFPALACALGAFRRSQLKEPAMRFVVLAAAAFCGAVIATQYDVGGASEWGGRYFALAVPILAPVVVVALASLREPAQRIVAVTVVVASVAVGATGIMSTRLQHERSANFVAAITEAQRELGSTTPVVALGGIPARFMWRTVDNDRWLLSPRGDLERTVDGVRAAGEQRVLVIGQPSRDEFRGFLDRSDVEAQRDVGGWTVARVRLGGT